MQGNTANELVRLWSRLLHVHMHLDLHGIVAHLHDAGLSALAAAIIMLGVVILLELRSVARMRQVMDRSLDRVFEQLDLLRFETQLLEEQWESRETGSRRQAAVQRPVRAHPSTLATVPSAPAAPTAPVASVAPVAPAASSAPAESVAGAAIRELAERRNLSSGEARLLSSLAEARARRAVTAGTARA